METTVHIGWLTAGVAVFSALLGFSGASLTMFKVQTARCEKQRGECAAALMLRVENYKVEFARRDVLDERFKRIELSLADIKRTVDYIGRQNGYGVSDVHSWGDAERDG
jgi:hypothetical protein